jgi:hypothetical protein
VITCPQIQSHPTPNIWDDTSGIRDEDGKIIRDEAGRYLREDHDQRPTTPPATDYFAWFKADALPQINDSAVATWPDSGTQGNDLTSSNAARTHLFLTSTPDANGAGGNGPVVRWSDISHLVRGADDGHTINTAGRTGCSWLYIGRRTSFTSYPALYSLSASKLTTDGAILETISGTTNTLNVPGIVATPTILFGNWHVFSLTYDESEGLQTFQTNDATVTGPIAGGGAGLIPLDVIQFQHEFGEVKELLVFKRKLTAAELYGCRSYLARKYSIQIA